MPILKLSIHDKIHNISCQDGEEGHLLHLAEMFSKKVTELSNSYPNASDSTLYLMAALIICDELHDCRKKLLSQNPPASEDAQEAITKTLEMVTEHIDYIAKKIDK
jgi:cell division protein ZapA